MKGRSSFPKLQIEGGRWLFLFWSFFIWGRGMLVCGMVTRSVRSVHVHTCVFAKYRATVTLASLLYSVTHLEEMVSEEDVSHLCVSDFTMCDPFGNEYAFI